MSDPNNNPRPGSGNLVWIIVAVVVVIGVIWYVMRDSDPAVTTEPPAAEAPAVEAPAVEAPAVEAPAPDAAPAAD